MSKLKEISERLLKFKEQDQNPRTAPVFVFETLMNKKLQELLLGKIVHQEEDSIKNWKEISVETKEGKDYHTIVPSLGDIVKGQALYVSQDDISKLDTWEDQYERKVCILSSGVKGYVYITKVEDMKDFGQNTSVELNDDDLALIKKYLED